MRIKAIKEINEYHLSGLEEGKPQFTVYDLNEYQKVNNQHNTKPHIHSFYQIIWFKKGVGKHFVDFKSYDVHDNAIFFIAKNQVHYFDENPDYEGVLLHFNESFLVQNDDEVEFFLKCNMFNSPFQQPSCCIGNAITPDLEMYLSIIKKELQNINSFGKNELLRSVLKMFLIQVQRCKNDFGKEQMDLDATQNEKRLQLLKFVTILDENFKKGFTVAEYAGMMSISTRTLLDITNQFLGKTPSQMIQEKIILEAKRLLLHSSLNVAQVGYRLGFEDPSYFVKYFKRHSHQSPLEFRKSIS
ncbi:helix-turn-helix transcriptional regulator [Chryseobacterium sp. CFS15]|uniref:AraC family transcriptional regulator n=1 Tax=Chryseobacterium sp. CFS15 TaxID=2986946 RepID=UPI00280980F3|nr:helix-turn-helix transcriptional regulator [Chryseobacterium sp. CFS15]MDQ8141461.1 helix-turn-helix transcriptional regulator [Chryseobacterium sp. CFS15]